MNIDLNKVELTAHPNFKGGEKELWAFMQYDGLNRILKGVLKPGASIGEHLHDAGSEIMFFLAGEGEATLDGVTEPVKAGCCHYCPKGSSHCVKNTGTEDLVFYAVVPQQ